MQAIVFLTHRTDRRILRHFARVKREANLDTFLCLHRPTPNLGISRGDLTVTLQDSQLILPVRYVEKQVSGRPFNNGFNDLIYFPAFQQLKHYEHIWVIEYDVDFAGDWGRFFARQSKTDADFVGTTIVPQIASAKWDHWSWFVAPHGATPFRSFIPICRLSSQMIECYRRSVETGHWKGHFEALFPTIALYHGLRVRELDGYFNTPSDPGLSPGTLVFRPVQSDRYFHEAPENFSRAGFLYHPVKPQPNFARRVFGQVAKLVQ
jgi:hypothetical protein